MSKEDAASLATMHPLFQSILQAHGAPARERISLKLPTEVAVLAIVVSNTGCEAVRASYLDACLVEDLGADPWLECDGIANDLEDRFGIVLDDDCRLRDPHRCMCLRVRDLIEMVGEFAP